MKHKTMIISILLGSLFVTLGILKSEVSTICIDGNPMLKQLKGMGCYPCVNKDVGDCTYTLIQCSLDLPVHTECERMVDGPETYDTANDTGSDDSASTLGTKTTPDCMQVQKYHCTFNQITRNYVCTTTPIGGAEGRGETTKYDGTACP